MIQRRPHPVLYRLQRALDTYADRSEVAEALAAAEEIDDELPPLLRYRAEERIAAHRMIERRRIAFGVACVVTVFGAIVGGFGLTTLNQMRSFRTSESEFQNLIDNEQWDEASRFLNSLDDTTRGEAVFAEGAEKIQAAEQREDQRQREFAKLVEELRLGPPDALDQEKVDRLNELAMTDQELATAAAFAAKADEQRLLREASRADDQTSMFESLQNEVERFFTTEAKSLDEDKRQTRRFELQQQLNQFVSRYHLTNPELASAAKQAASMLTQAGNRDKKQSKRQDYLDSITDSVGDSVSFFKQTQRLIEELPQDALSGDLQANEESLRTMIAATTAWERVRNDRAFVNGNDLSSRSAKEWIARVEKATSLDASHPFRDSLERWQDHYHAVAKRPELVGRLQSMFASPLMQTMYVYPDSEGNAYFCNQMPPKDSDRAHVVEYFADRSLSNATKNFGLRFRQEVEPKIRLAGHSQYAAKNASLTASIRDQDFTPTMYRLINDLKSFRSQPAMDPVCRLELMRQFLDIATQGSVPFDEAFADWKEAFDTSDFAWDTNWVSPAANDAPLQDARDQATKLLASSGDWKARVNRMLATFKALQGPRPTAPRWVGWVAQEGNRHVGLLSPAFLSEPTRPKGELFVVAPDPKTGKAVLVKLASSQSNTSVVVDDPKGQITGAMICYWDKS